MSLAMPRNAFGKQLSNVPFLKTFPTKTCTKDNAAPDIHKAEESEKT